MTLKELLNLAPLILLTLTTVGVMLHIAFARRYHFIGAVTILGMNLALLSLPLLWLYNDGQPVPVTPLLVMDGYALFYSGLILACALGVLTLCGAYFESYQGNREELYLLLLMSTLGAVVMAMSRHFAGFFIGLELMSIPLYAMVAYPVKDSRALEGGIKYLILSAAASAFMLFGMVTFSHLFTGSLLFLSCSQVCYRCSSIKGHAFKHGIC